MGDNLNELDDFTSDDGGLRELALFAGAGGGILGGQLLGWRTVCAVEIEPYAAGVLLARQNDGCLPPFPVWDDIQTFDGRPWKGIVDVISGGFPCQDISVAGKGAGITGERSGLWKEFARIIREVRPRFVFVENSPVLTSRGFDVVLGDLAALGFDAEWGVLSAAAVGAPHLRERIWIIANSDKAGLQKLQRQEKRGKGSRSHPVSLSKTWSIRDTSKAFILRGANGMAARVDRIKALGNGQVPFCAAMAFRLLLGRFTSKP